jgi:hypothetical protein
MYQTIWCPNPDHITILTTVSISNSVPKNIKNNWRVNANISLGKLNYRGTECFLQTQDLVSHTFPNNCVHSVPYFASKTNRGNKTWNTDWLQTDTVSINTHFRIRNTYDEFQSSTKLIPQAQSQTQQYLQCWTFLK